MTQPILTAMAAGAVGAVVAGGLFMALDEKDNRYEPAVQACAVAQRVDLDNLREKPRVAERGHPGYPQANLNVLLLPDPVGSARCYFRVDADGEATLLGSSKD